MCLCVCVYIYTYMCVRIVVWLQSFMPAKNTNYKYHPLLLWSYVGTEILSISSVTVLFFSNALQSFLLHFEIFVPLIETIRIPALIFPDNAAGVLSLTRVITLPMPGTCSIVIP
eukprot:m.119369 g.119369  ORF g.119369 m.119369 type:complete len:114 (+) comp28732_c0_seq1:177-518(+)